MPASAMVGTSGSAGSRCADDTASARTRPAAAARGERHDVEHHVDVAGDEVLQRRRGAAVMHVRDVDAGELLELLAGRWPEPPRPCDA